MYNWEKITFKLEGEAFEPEGRKAKEALKGFDSYMIEHIRRNQNKKADILSKMASMTFEHLTKEVLIEVLAKSGLLPEDPKEARKIRVKAPQYKLIRGGLYRRATLDGGQNYEARILLAINAQRRHNGNSRVQKMQGAICDKESSQNQRNSSWKWMVVQSLGNLCKGLKVTQSFSPVTEHIEIMNHIKKQLTRSQQGWVDDLAQVLWVHRTLPRNSQKETLFSLTYGSEAIIPIAKNTLAKDDKRRTKEVTKKKEGKEVASIE
ncbi:reverse transcriptase domain-containing protein [Tanacetum coccineum]